MRFSPALALALITTLLFPVVLLAQSPQGTGETQPPLLSIEDAVSIALAQNRLVKNAALEAQKFDFRVSTAKSRRLPQFQFAVLGGELMHSFDFTFPEGAFGTYPGVGPIPNKEATIRNPARLTTFVTGNLDQPLTQQYKIGLAIHATEIGKDIAREDIRAERQKIAAQVRNAYYEIVATQASVDALREAVKTLEESQRVTKEYRLQKTVLQADALEVEARLAKSRFDLSVSENGLATQCEHLNQLLGRDVTTPFRVDYLPESDEADLSLQDARQRAQMARPEVRQAELKQKQAEYDRRLAKAEYIPDLSLSVRYMGLNNVEVLPGNVGVAGFYLSWEPFDWGRRRNLVSEKAKTVEQARNGTEEARSQIAVEVGAKYRKWRDAVLLLKAARTQHDANTERFRVVSAKYQEQAALIKDLLEAQAHKTEADFQYQQALSSYWGALADLRRAMGEE